MPRRALIATGLVSIAFLYSMTITASTCYTSKEMRITNEHPPVHMADGISRVMAVSFQLPVDCRNSALLRPQTESEAVEWFDRSLSLDLRATMLRGESPAPYANGNYGVSLVEDLYDFFMDAWDLDNAKYCSKLGSKASMRIPEMSCAARIFHAWREHYEGTPTPD